jgi:ComF family protein
MCTWLHRLRGELACFEKMILGRTRPDAEGAVREALALCGRDPWCRGCGRSLQLDLTADDGKKPAARRLCGRCLERPLFDGFVRLGRYAPPLDRLVQRVKGSAWHDVAEAFGRELARAVVREMPMATEGWIVVPVPSPAFRRWRRGIDHTDTMAKAFCRELGARSMHGLRATLASRQASLRRSERLRSARLAWRGRATVPAGMRVLLIDDVRTTGGTLFKARELLIRHGAKFVVPAVVCVRDEM